MTSLKHGNVFAVYDISSSSVAGAHALHTTEGGIAKTVLLASTRLNAPLQEDLNMQRFVEDACKQLHDVITVLRQEDLHQPSYIQLTLASPWYTSQTRTITYKRETPFTCTQKLVDSLIDAEIAHIISNEEGSFGAFGKESVIVEKQLSGIALNGYPTTKPFGKEASTLELYLTITIAPKPVLERFKDVVKRGYGTRRIGFTTSPFTTYIVMRDVKALSEDCVVIDVGEEVTDIACVKGGIMRYQHSFPMGTYGLYRALAEHATTTVNESMALLEAYRLGKASRQTARNAEKAIETFQTTWQTWLHKILDTGDYGFSLPTTCIVHADPRFEKLIIQIIKKDSWMKHVSARGAVTIQFMNESVYGDRIVTADFAPVDATLATGALFVERMMQ